MFRFSVPRLKQSAVALGALVMASCTVTPPPVLQTAQLAPPPLVTVPPLRPAPPFGASLETLVPGRDALGGRQTVNSGITTPQAVWNLRSAWNVAALNCIEPRYASIIDGYRMLLENNDSSLTALNRSLDAQYRGEFGREANAVRDRYSTQVYNYFALPPAQTYFCEAVLATSGRYNAAPPSDLEAFALVELPQIEASLFRFFGDFEQFRVDRQAWTDVYGSQYGQVYQTFSAAPPINDRSDAIVQPLPDQSATGE